MLLIKPRKGISTAHAYRSIQNYSPEAYDPDAAFPPESEWESFFRNDFQEWACGVQAEIGRWIAYLKGKGAFYAAMSGSGSSVFGLFRDKAPEVKVDKDIFCWKGKLRI
jgi:4-diphosphocytidyl-2-C-methyl-D-erythritol kinase